MSEVELGEHHGLEGSNKKVALLISVLALLLSIAEIVGTSAQTEALQKNIEASNLWAHFQAKTVRVAVAEGGADQLQAMLVGITEPSLRRSIEQQISSFRSAISHLESDKTAGDGRTELGEQAREAEKARDRHGKRHHRFELSKGAFQIGIVLASAMVITGIGALLWLAGGLGVIGTLLLLSGMMV